MVTTALGKIMCTPRGDYNASASYLPLDIIAHDGGSYIVIQPCSGITPPNTDYYMSLASKGDRGPSGFDAITEITSEVNLASLLTDGIYIADASLVTGGLITDSGKVMIFTSTESSISSDTTIYYAHQLIIHDNVYFRQYISETYPFSDPNAQINLIRNVGPVAFTNSGANFLDLLVESLTVTDTTESTSTTTGAVTIAGGLGVAGAIYADTVVGAVYNDYAEYRCCNQHILPGSVVVEVGDDTVICSSDRLQLGAMIISDTYGFCIGNSDKAVPVAISGRVLAFPFEDREVFKNSIGRAVCSGPNGTVSLMSDQEVKDNPLAIIGTVSAVPDYDTWGSNNIQVLDRVWIRIK